MSARIAILALAACTHPAAPVAPSPAPSTVELSPALVPLAWWLGTWTERAGQEIWLANSGAIYGVALHDDGSYELRIVDDAATGGPADGVIRMFAMPQQLPPAELDATGPASGTSIVFRTTGPAAIAYRRDGEQLTATVTFAKREGVSHFARAPMIARDPELEGADREFATAVAARGVDAWVAAFDAEGAMGRASGKISGADAIREAMAKLLAAGLLAWEPIASGRHGDLGFTIGKATYEPTDKNPDDRFRSSYATIWRRQPDGHWKVLFDAGRAVNE